MLKLKHLIEDDKIAKALMNQFPIEVARIVFFRSSSNVVYYVKDLHEQSYFLRYTFLDEKDPALIEQEMLYLSQLQHAGYPANTPILSRDGRYVVNHGDVYAVLLRAVDGGPLDDIEMTEEIAALWGYQLALLHKLSSDMKSIQRETLQERIHFIRHTLTDPALLDALTIWEQESTLLSEPAQLIHYDFEMDNVFFENGKIHVIDFDDMIIAPTVIDIAQVMMNIEDDLDGDLATKNAFLKGYEQLLPIPSSSDIASACQFIHFNSCAKLTRTLSNPPEIMPDWMPEIVEKLKHAYESHKQAIIG